MPSSSTAVFVASAGKKPEINDRQKRNLSEIVLISNNARKLIIHYMIVSNYVIHLGTYIALNHALGLGKASF